jgi:hypothetical protein
MEISKILELICELEALIGDYPGKNPEALKKFEKIGQLLNDYEKSNSYTKEKILDVIQDSKLWFSDNGWKKFSLNPRDFKVRFLTSIRKLKNAFQTLKYPQKET